MPCNVAVSTARALSCLVAAFHYNSPDPFCDLEERRVRLRTQFVRTGRTLTYHSTSARFCRSFELSCRCQSSYLLKPNYHYNGTVTMSLGQVSLIKIAQKSPESFQIAGLVLLFQIVVKT